MGGLTAGREGHDVIAHISSHTVCVRARGSVSQSISMAQLNHKQSVCILTQSSRAGNAAD